MRPEYPIECKCSHRSEFSQLVFARKAMQMLPARKEIALQPTKEGLAVLAETEMALEHPVMVLREIYGDRLRIGPPSVRYVRGARVEEPHMGLRVLCAPGHFEAVRLDLRLRGAVILDAEVNLHYGIVRACAPLALLVGYPARVKHLTGGQAQLVMWLNRYAPVDEPPPGGEAA